MRIKLAFPTTVGEISRMCNGETSLENVPIEYITTNSKEVRCGDLFFCIKGEKYDGENFLDEVISRGGYAVSTSCGDRQIRVNSTHESLLLLAKRYLSNFAGLKKKIAITGSVGKTTTKELLYHILSKEYRVHKTPENKNNHIGMPLTILCAPSDSEIFDIEMGMNHRGEIKELSECLSPDIGIITNIGSSHIGNLGSREEIANAKLEILCGMKGGTLIIPKEERLLTQAKPCTTFSTTDFEADICLNLKDDDRISIYYQGSHFCDANYSLKAPHLLKCLAPAAAAAILCGIQKESLVSAISTIPDDITGQNILRRKNLFFYTDYYNASYESIIAAFETMKQLDQYTTKSLLLADIGELGDHSEQIHRLVGGSIPKEIFSRLYFFGSNAEIMRQEAIKSGFNDESIYFNTDPDRPDITANQIKSSSDHGELILMKGSRFMRLERVLDYF